MAAFSPPPVDSLIEEPKQQGFVPPSPDSLILPTNALGENVEDLKSAMARVRRERVGGDIAEGAAKAGEFLTRGVSHMFPTTAIGQTAEALGIQPPIPAEHVRQAREFLSNLPPNAGVPEDAPRIGPALDPEVSKGVNQFIDETISGLTRPDQLALLAAGGKYPLPVARTFQLAPAVELPQQMQQLQQQSEAGDVAGTAKSAAGIASGVLLPFAIQKGINESIPPLRMPDFPGGSLPTPEGAIPPRPRKVYEQPDATAPAAPVEPANVVFGKPEVPFTPPDPRIDVPYLKEIRAAGAKTKEEIQKLFPGISREHAARVRDEAWPEDALARKQKEAAIPPLNERIDNALQRETAEAIPPLRERPVESVQQVPAERPGAEAGSGSGTPEEKGQVTTPLKVGEVPTPHDLHGATLEQFMAYHDALKGPGTQRAAVNEFGKSLSEEGIKEAERLAQLSREKAGQIIKGEGDLDTKFRQSMEENQRTQFLDEGARTAKARKAVNEGMDAAEAIKKFGVPPSAVEDMVKAPEASAAPKAPEVNFGIWPESEWSAASLAKQTPGERIGKAKFLGLRDKEGQLILGPKTLADAAAKRIQQIKADAAKPKPAPAPEPETLTASSDHLSNFVDSLENGDVIHAGGEKYFVVKHEGGGADLFAASDGSHRYIDKDGTWASDDLEGFEEKLSPEQFFQDALPNPTVEKSAKKLTRDEAETLVGKWSDALDKATPPNEPATPAQKPRELAPGGRFDHLLSKIQEQQNKRDWSKVPAGLQAEAVKALWDRELKDSFKNPISARIAASKATTFEELAAAIQQGKENYLEGEAPKQALPKVGEPLLDVKPSTRKSLQTLRSQIVKRLEELTDIDPVTGEMTIKEDRPDEEYTTIHVKKLKEKLKEVETKLMHGEDVVSAAAAKREAAAPAKAAATPKGPGSEASPIEVSKEAFDEKGSIMEAYSADKFPKIRKPFSHNGKFYTIGGIEGGPASKAWGHELTQVPTETPVVTKRVWTPENRDKGYEGDVVQYQGKKYRLGPKQYFAATKEAVSEAKPVVAETKPAIPETKPPISETAPATKAAEPAIKAPEVPSSEPSDLGSIRKQLIELGKKRDEAVSRLIKSREAKSGSPEELSALAEASKNAATDVDALTQRMASLGGKIFDAEWKAETAPFRGKPPEKPSPPAITSKVLKAQRENLLEQVDEALKEAPEEGAEKIKIAVPGDGEFTIRNTKSSLKAFRDHAAKEFPATVGGINQPGVKSGKPSTIPKVEDPAVTDLPKIAGKFVSDDPTRQGITGSYADGTQVVATNGRQLIRIWTDKAPGTPMKPVRFNAEGKPVEIEGKMANFQQIRSDKPELLKGGVPTDDLFKLAAQAKIFAKEEKGMTSMKLLVNKDGTIGARMALNNGDLFEHNVKPDALNLGNFNPQYIMDQAEAARRLGNEKVDLYAHSGDGGPMGFVGKNHEGLLMPMRLAEEKTFRDEAKAFDSVAGKKSHPSPVTGLGPIADPDAYIRRDTPNSGYIVLLENGKIRLEQLGPGGNPRKVGTELPIEKFGKSGSVQNASIKQMLKDVPHNAAAVSEIRVAANDALEARGEAVKAVEARREAEIKRNALRLHIIPPVPDWLANIAKSAGRALYRARKAFPTIVDSRQARHWMDQSRDAADNLADIAAQQMGKRIKTGHTDIEDRAASAMIAGKFDPAEFPGLIAKAIRGGNLEARQALEYALGHWTEVEPMARAGEKIFENQLADENAAGINTEYHEGYLPGVYDEDLWMGAGRPFVIGGRSSGGVSTGFKKGKTYATPYDAISDGYVPKTLKLSDLVENRVKRGQRLINRKAWANALRSIVDPTDHKPIVEDLQYVSRGPGLPGFEKAPIGYVAREIIPGTRIAVRENYAKLFDALTGRSVIAEFEPGGIPVGTMALEGAGGIKHGLLVFDSFHAGRILQKELFLTGKVSYRKGQSLLEYADADLAAAVRAGDIKPEWAAWARANRPTANLLIKAGLNVGRIQEGMYNSLVRDVPVIGRFNKWVFEKMTRGAMLQSGLLEFERVRNANPGWSDEQVAAKVARDLNKYFGNLGRQGVFKSPSFQDAARLVALAPNWVESMARSELGGVKQLTYDPIMNRSLHIGSLGRGLAQGLAAYFVGTQLLNLATRGHLTWQNPEEGHKWDAWVPDIAGRSGGYFLSPMGVVAELTHDMIKYSKTEPNVLAAAWRIMRNRSSPFFRAGRILLGGRDWDDSKINDAWDRVKKAAVAVLPTPIPLQTVGKTVKPGQVQRQVVSSLGFKLDTAETPRVQIMNQGRAWALNNADPKIKAAAEREQTGDRSDSVYKPLRLALSKNDRQGIIDEVRAIVQLEPKERQAERLKEVLKNVDPFSSNGIKPFATPIHSKAAEVAFVKSMNGNQKAAYKQAVKDAVKDYRKLTEAIYGKPRNPPDVPEAYRDLLK